MSNFIYACECACGCEQGYDYDNITICAECQSGEKHGIGNCDTCGSEYETHSREGRCGDCGDCSTCCGHSCLHESLITGLGGDRWCVACGEPDYLINSKPKGE